MRSIRHLRDASEKRDMPFRNPDIQAGTFSENVFNDAKSAPSRTPGRVFAAVSKCIDVAAGTPERAFAAFAAYAVFLGCIQVGTIGLSLASVQISQRVAVGIVLLSFLVALFYGYLYRKTCPSNPSMRRETFPLSRGGAVIALFIAAFYCCLWFFAYVKPDLSPDGNVYHIPTIHLWAQKGYVHWIKPDYSSWSNTIESFMNGYPKGVELISYVLVTATGASGLVNSCNLVYLLLAVLGIIYLARALDASPYVAVAAGMLYVLVPVNVMQSPTTLTDSGYASTVVAVAAATCYSYASLRAGLFPWAGVPAVACSMGLACGAKGSGPIAVAVGIAVVLCGAALALVRPLGNRSTGSSATSGPEHTEAPTTLTYSRIGIIWKAPLFIFLVGTLGLATGGYWQVRNFRLKGSPIFPVGVTIAGKEVFPGVSVAQALSEEHNTPEELRPLSPPQRLLHTWLQGRSEWPGSLRGTESRLGGIGYLWLVGCVPSVLFLLVDSLISFIRRWRNREPTARTIMSIFVALPCFTALLFALTPMRWWARYTLWIYALGLPCFAVVATRALRSRSVFRYAVGFWAAACLGLATFEGVYSLSWMATRTYRGLRDWPDFAAAPGRAIRTLTWHDPVGYLFPPLSGTMIDEILNSTEAVALPYWKITKKGFIGQLCQPIGARRVYFLDHGLCQDQEKLRRFLQDRNIRYVIWDYTFPFPKALENLSSDISHIPHYFRVATIPRVLT